MDARARAVVSVFISPPPLPRGLVRAVRVAGATWRSPHRAVRRPWSRSPLRPCCASSRRFCPSAFACATCASRLCARYRGRLLTTIVLPFVTRLSIARCGSSDARCRWRVAPPSARTDIGRAPGLIGPAPSAEQKTNATRRARLPRAGTGFLCAMHERS